MGKMRTDYADVDEYIATFPITVQRLLEQMRATIRNHAPEAVEAISYGMVGYKLLGKPLLYFGGFKNHLGLFATPSGNITFAKELSHFKTGKGSVQFPLDQPLPLDLVARIVTFRVETLTQNAGSTPARPSSRAPANNSGLN